jgi:hypothetical protein
MHLACGAALGRLKRVPLSGSQRARAGLRRVLQGLFRASGLALRLASDHDQG